MCKTQLNALLEEASRLKGLEGRLALLEQEALLRGQQGDDHTTTWDRQQV